MPATATPTARKDPKARTDGAGSQAPPEQPAADEGAAKQRPLKIAAALAGIVLLAYGAFFLASPSQRVAPHLSGPFTTELFPDKYQVNLAGAGMKRFLQVILSVIYDAYDDGYTLQRARDPLYEPYLQSTVLAICSGKTVEEVQGRANKDALMEELRAELDPVLFPVHVGETRFALDQDQRSGLRPGLSHDRSTFRGTFHDHALQVDGPGHSIRLADGPAVTFLGDEIDLEVTTAEGKTLYLDVTRLQPGFSGTVQTGVHGRIRRILPKYFLVQ